MSKFINEISLQMIEKEVALEKKLLDWMKSNQGKILNSPREEVFKSKRVPQKFMIVEVDESKRRVKVKFMKQGTSLPLEYWRFNKVIELITKANGEYIRLGASIYPDAPQQSSGNY